MAIDIVVAVDTVEAAEAVDPECILAPDDPNDTSSHRTNAITLFYIAYLLALVLPLWWGPTLATYFTDRISFEISAKVPEGRCQREGARVHGLVN